MGRGVHAGPVRPTGKIYGDLWRSLDWDGRRAFLVEHGAKVHAVRGARPITISIEGWEAAWRGWHVIRPLTMGRHAAARNGQTAGFAQHYCMRSRGGNEQSLP